jgi:hypothetical protein
MTFNVKFSLAYKRRGRQFFTTVIEKPMFKKLQFDHKLLRRGSYTMLKD